MFLSIHKHYLHVERERTTEVPISPKDIHHRFLLPVAHLTAASQRGLAYARSITPEVTAIHVVGNQQETGALRAVWGAWQSTLPVNERTPLQVVEPAGRSKVGSLLEHIDATHHQFADETLTVLLPEITQSSPLGRLLHNPTILQLKARLFLRPAIIVANLTHTASEQAPIPQPQKIHHRFIVPIAELDRPSLQSLAYARSISSYVAAAHVAMDEHEVAAVQEKWERLQKHLGTEEETSLVVIESPYRSLLRPLLAYIDTVRANFPEDTLTVILPEFVVAHWWEFPLHNQTALQLKTALLSRSGIVVTDIPQHLRKVPKEG